MARPPISLNKQRAKTWLLDARRKMKGTSKNASSRVADVVMRRHFDDDIYPNVGFVREAVTDWLADIIRAALSHYHGDDDDGDDLAPKQLELLTPEGRTLVGQLWKQRVFIPSLNTKVAMVPGEMSLELIDEAIVYYAEQVDGMQHDLPILRQLRRLIERGGFAREAA